MSREEVKLRLVDSHDLNKVFSFNSTKKNITLDQILVLNNLDVKKINLCDQDIRKVNKIDVDNLRTQIRSVTFEDINGK